MRGFVSIFVVYVLLALESPLLDKLDLAFYAPDLALIVVLHLAMGSRTAAGVLTAMAIGLLKDGFALGSPVGLYTEVLVVVFLLAKIVGRRFRLNATFTGMLTAFVGSLVSSVMFLLLTLIFDRSFDDYGLIFRMMGPQAIVTAPFAPLIFMLMERVDRLTIRRRGTLFFG